MEKGSVAVIRKDGALGRVQIFRREGLVFSYKASYWADERTASTRPPDQTSEGTLQGPYYRYAPDLIRRRQYTIFVGPWRLGWSMGDEDHYWIRADETFDLSIEAADSP